MREHILALKPDRWKVFQALRLEGENSGKGAKREVETFLISSEEFQAFVKRHEETGVIVPESNSAMQNSYLILDERMRFLDCTQGSKRPSQSILKVSVHEALSEAGFDADMFVQRKGIYDWSKKRITVTMDNTDTDQKSRNRTDEDEGKRLPESIEW